MRDAERRRVICSHVVEERPDRRQTSVARLDCVLPRLLKLVQEGENDVAVEMPDGQFARPTPGLIGGGRSTFGRQALKSGGETETSRISYLVPLISLNRVSSADALDAISNEKIRTSHFDIVFWA